MLKKAERERKGEVRAQWMNRGRGGSKTEETMQRRWIRERRRRRLWCEERIGGSRERKESQWQQGKKRDRMKRG